MDRREASGSPTGPGGTTAARVRLGVEEALADDPPDWQAAGAVIFQQLRPYVTYQIAGRLRRRADLEDAVEEVFLQLLSTMSRAPLAFREKFRENGVGGLMCLLRTMSRQTAARWNERPLFDTIDDHPCLPAPDGAWSDGDRLSDAAWSVITEEDPEGLLRLHYGCGFSYQEIAARLDRTPDAVRVAAGRIRRRVRERLTAEGLL